MLLSWGLEETAVDDLTTLLSVLRRFDGLSVDEFSSLALRDKAKSKTISGGGVPVPLQLDETLISAYLEKLQRALSDRASFLSVTSEMAGDKKLKLSELNAIGVRLANIEGQKSKKQTLDVIISWAHRKFDTERRRRETSGLF